MTTITPKYRGTREDHLIHAELVTADRYRGVVTYGRIAELMNLLTYGGHMASETGYLLGEISEDEVLQNRPMLSAVAVNTSGKPGDGFFGLAVQLAKLPGDSTEQQKDTFWEAERRRVYETWRNTSLTNLINRSSLH